MSAHPKPTICPHCGREARGNQFDARWSEYLRVTRRNNRRIERHALIAGLVGSIVIAGYVVGLALLSLYGGVAP